MSTERILGAAALVLWVGHSIDGVAHGLAADLLWMCNIAGLLLAVGLLGPVPRLAAVATLWLAIGVPIWVLDLLAGGEARPWSIASHAGGLLIAGFAASRAWPDRAWRDATGALVVLWVVCRLATPPGANVNLAFSVWPGWEGVFPSHGPYVAFLAAVCAAVFAAVDWLLRRYQSSRNARTPSA